LNWLPKVLERRVRIILCFIRVDYTLHTTHCCRDNATVVNCTVAARPCNVFAVLRRVRNCLTIITIIIIFVFAVTNSFVGWVSWFVKTVPEMTYKVSSGMLSHYSVNLFTVITTYACLNSTCPHIFIILQYHLVFELVFET